MQLAVLALDPDDQCRSGITWSNPVKRPIALVLASFVLGSASFGPSAFAARKATETERAALAQAAQAPRRCLRIQVSTARRGWASVSFKAPARASCLRYATDGVSVWRRRDDVWRQRFAGSSWSCPIPGIPEAVREDLDLDCPEGGH
jgi:hypothetical protein